MIDFSSVSERKQRGGARAGRTARDLGDVLSVSGTNQSLYIKSQAVKEALGIGEPEQSTQFAIAPDSEKGLSIIVFPNEVPNKDLYTLTNPKNGGKLSTGAGMFDTDFYDLVDGVKSEVQNLYQEEDVTVTVKDKNGNLVEKTVTVTVMDDDGNPVESDETRTVYNTIHFKLGEAYTPDFGPEVTGIEAIAYPLEFSEFGSISSGPRTKLRPEEEEAEDEESNEDAYSEE